MSEQRIQTARVYEIRLARAHASQLVFAAAKSSDDEAAQYARSLLARHPEYERAEIWCGMRHVRAV